MKPDTLAPNGAASPLVQVRSEPPGRFTAQAVGLPEIQATAATREEAVEGVRAVLAQWLASGRLITLAVPSPPAPQRPSGWAESDRLEREFVEDLARFRQEDLERTPGEDGEGDGGSPSTSSTRTTFRGMSRP